MKGERSIRIEWHGDKPNLEPLTGNEAKAILASVLVEQRKVIARFEALEAQRSALTKCLVGLVHRECVRGLLDANGEPMLPMRTVLPADSVRVACEDWRFSTQPQPDSTVEVLVDRPAPPVVAEEAPPRLQLVKP